MAEAEAPPYPQPRTCPYQPPAGYREIAESGPVLKVTLFDGRESWMVTGYKESREILTHPNLSSLRTHPNFPIVAPRFRSQIARSLALIAMDPPVHDTYRRYLNPHFSLKQVRRMRPEIEKIVSGFVDRIIAQGPPADLVPLLAVPLPSLIICRHLGVPYEDHEFFQDASGKVMLGTEEESATAAQNLVDYIDALVTEQIKSPTDGLLGRLVTERVLTGDIGHEELVSIALVLLIAAHETTSSSLALGVITLLEHPDQLAKLLEDRDRLPGAVEELLRFIATTDLVATRVAKGDIEIAGHLIREGEAVLVSGTLANRDAKFHERPDEFDVLRSDTHHVTFGFGIHQCLGQNLARLELEIAFRELFTRLPGLRLATDVADLPILGAGTVQRVLSLPVEW
ncbi:cytochrome P450 [Streptomyces sp. SID8381]|uniref:cytochrome P450 n=1 Tax=unclassified Streptomyces TaxID=2593676 RepID=UPI0003A43B54|nr:MULTISPECIES: cytochrome P450 [unclassified Streptomyces]MYX30308.1 cytochrome P450 [Streptomyces sp. SID8381]MYX44392.1 cytochrome P450 [Streptomyces sp. SID89]NMO33630.1 cytochrome P450 [Streptomyces sp. GMY02]